jgi:hypothetical protein
MEDASFCHMIENREHAIMTTKWLHSSTFLLMMRWDKLGGFKIMKEIKLHVFLHRLIDK